MDQQQVERFRPTSGRVPGVLALLLVAALLLVGVLDRGSVPLPVMAGAVLGGILAWASMLRPALWATADRLVMRNMLETVHVPLAAIEQLAVRQVLAVRAGERRYVSTVVGRSLRKMMRGRPAPEPTTDEARPVTEMPYADFVEERLHQLMSDARASAGVSSLSDEQLALAEDVRREPAWAIIGLIAVATLAFVVALLV